jgi:hypothetical protein
MEVVAVSFATDSDYDDDLGHGYIRRPISVAELFEREGYRPAMRSKATKRALSGVAAGAVLALGAVVGSLLLNHGGTTTAGDTLASGGIGQSGGDIVLAETSPQATTIPTTGATHVNPTTSGTSGTTATSGTSRTTLVPVGGSLTTATGGTQRGTSTGNQGPGNHSPVAPSTSSGTNGGVVTSPTTGTATSTTTNPPATTSTPTTGTTTTTPTAPSTSTTPTSGAPTTTTGTPTTGSGSTTTTPTTSSGDGGLLGSVTGTLGDVTSPVFNWFG